MIVQTEQNVLAVAVVFRTMIPVFRVGKKDRIGLDVFRIVFQTVTLVPGEKTVARMSFGKGKELGTAISAKETSAAADSGKIRIVLGEWTTVIPGKQIVVEENPNFKHRQMMTFGMLKRMPF